MKSALLKIVTVVFVVALGAFVLWWNYRLFSWFIHSGVHRLVAGSLVWGPFVVIGIWLVWRWRCYRSNRA
jgi:hypothetical protein